MNSALSSLYGYGYDSVEEITSIIIFRFKKMIWNMIVEVEILFWVTCKLDWSFNVAFYYFRS